MRATLTNVVHLEPSSTPRGVKRSGRRRALRPCLHRTIASASLLGSALLHIGCTDVREGPSPYTVETKPLRILAVNANLAADGRLSRHPRLQVCFSEILAPQTVRDDDFTISTSVLGYDLVIEHELLSYRDPVDDRLLASERWCPGSVVTAMPRSVMPAGVLARMRITLSPLLLGSP